MTSSDASKYQSLESTAKKWYDIELKNSKDWGIAQSTAIMRKGYSPVRDIAFTENFNIGYLPAERSIVLKNSCQGNLVLVDLRGRVVTRINLSDLHTSGDATVSLPASLSTGLYMARFEGVNGIQQAKITVTK
jgi:hypothetical protein